MTIFAPTPRDKVAHPLMLRAIAVAKKKNDRMDAVKIADCLRCDFLPECYMAPMEIRQRRRMLRYRKLLVRRNVQLKNKIAQMLMEGGVSYNKGEAESAGLLPSGAACEPGDRAFAVAAVEALSRDDRTDSEDRACFVPVAPEMDPLLAARVERLMTIPAIGHVTALTWVLEVGEVERFRSIKQVISYCGLCSGEKSSAGTSRRMPISKQRNRNLQTVLLEAAHLAPRLNPELAALYEREAARATVTKLRSRSHVSWLRTFWPSIGEAVPS